MTERRRIFDDIAGVAGGGFSAIAGIREEAESVIKAGIEEAIRRLDLVRHADWDAAQERAANARSGPERAGARAAQLEERVAALGARVAGMESASGPPDITG